MLKAWIVNPDLGQIHIEEKYVTMASEERTDKYTTEPCLTDIYWNTLWLHWTSGAAFLWVVVPKLH